MEGNAPVVSIVTVTYNDGKYLRETIQSVLDQTFTDFEYIIWDDGSTDSTHEIVESFQDSRIRYFYADNQGVGGATIEACKQVRGRYIARLDGDDIWLPLKLEKQIGYLETHKDVVVLGCAVWCINEKSEIVGRNFQYTNKKIIEKFAANNSFVITHSSAVFRTADFLQIGGYVNIKSRLDVVLWTRFNQLGRIETLKEAFVKYRFHNESVGALTSSLDNGPYSQVILAFMNKIKRDCGRNQDDIDTYNHYYMLNKATKSKSPTIHQYQPSVEYKLYCFFSKLFGESIGANIIYTYKNLWGYFKYCVFQK